MRKTLITVLSMMLGAAAWAALPTVSSVQHVSTPQGMVVMMPAISPDGQFVVVSDASTDGLTQINISDGAAKTIAASATGHDVRISPDGKNVVFRHSVYDKNHLRQTGLKSVNLATGKEEVIVKPSRRLNAGISMDASGVYSIENGRLRSRSLSGTKTTAQPAVVSINYGHLELTAGGKTVTLDPQGKGSYLWPSLSPDGNKVLYYLSGVGCFVCDLQGNEIAALGQIRAAKWLDNETVVGMNDIDDGEALISSSIVAADLQGNRATLTEPEQVAMYPAVSADGSRIAYVTAEGQLFVLNLVK